MLGVGLLLLLFTVPQVHAQKTECTAYVQKLINDILDFKIASLPLPSLLYSGITSNNPGQLKQCTSSNYSYYLVFTKNITTMTEEFTGLCMPHECLASDIEIALEFLHCRVYNREDLKQIDLLAQVGAILALVWMVVLVSCSCWAYLKQPIINQYLNNEKNQLTDEMSGSVDTKEKYIMSFAESDSSGVFHFYEGYRKLFKISNKNNLLSVILFLAVLSFSVSIQFSYRQNIASNNMETSENLNSYLGIFVCNTEIALHTIIFVLGYQLACSTSSIKNLRDIGRKLFQLLLKKWIILILMSLLIYSMLTFTISEPLSLLWSFNNAKDCPLYIWQTWFAFRNLQLDCKICLPWFSLVEADLLLTILSAPLLIIYRISKKFGYFLIVVLVCTSLVISYSILKNQVILYEPTKLMNAEKQYSIDYQGNAFVRMGPFSLGLFFGFLVTQSSDPKKFQSKVKAKFNQLKSLQWLTITLGLGLMAYCYVLIRPFLNPQKYPVKQYFPYLLLTPLGFVFGLGLFILPCSFEGQAPITKFINKAIGWRGWIHLDRISMNFYMLAPMVIGYSTYSSQNSIYYDVWTMITYLIGDIFFTYFLSIFVTACLENQLVPMISWFQGKVIGKQSHLSSIFIEEL